MRPLRLAVEGMTAFPTRQEIDLSDLGLFCITGPTGAGKTTIFDAIAFALYGRAPRVANRIRRLVASGLSEVRVELEFAVGPETFRVARRLRRSASGGSQHRALLERREGAAWRPLADGADPVSAEIEEVTGLDFTAFTRAVMLPQGEFARLLGGEAAQRRAILVRLLALSRVEDAGRRARSEADALRGQERILRETLDRDMADATLDALRAAKEHLRTAEAGSRALDQSLATAREHEAAARKIVSSAERVLRIAAALDDLGAREDAARGESAELGPKEAESAARLTRAEAGRAEAEAANSRRRDEVEEAIRVNGDEAEHATLRAALRERTAAEGELRELSAEAESAQAALGESTQALRDRHADLRSAEESALATAREALDEAESRAAEASRALSEAQEARRRTTEDLAQLERRHLGASIRELIAEGDPCPVCDRPVDAALPPVPDDLAARRDAARAAAADAERDETRAAAADREAHARWRAARETVLAVEERLATLPDAPAPPAATRLTPSEARTAVEAAERETGRARERVAAVAARQASARERAEDATRRLAATFGSPLPGDVRDRLSQREERLARARRLLLEADVSRERARTQVEAAQSSQQEIAGARSRLDAGTTSRAAEKRRLAADLAEALEGTESADADARSLAAAARRAAERQAAVAGHAVAEITRIARTAGCAEPADGDWIAALESAARRAAATQARHEAEVSSLRNRVRQRSEREARIAQVAREASILETLALHLRGDRFVEFMLAESVETLCRRASARLGEMSGGRYSLEMEAGETSGELVVVDHHNADERRGVDTLSGGETFQASLALALALSESVADLGGRTRLDAVFVDEGFAALDAESLDLAIDALESVHAGGRMVGVITHMPQMAERIPEGLEVVRGPSGSSVVPRAA
jgi:exonuclease SbcC